MRSSLIPEKFPGIILVDDLEDYAVLFHPSTAETMGLNATGCFIWDLMDGSRTVSEISERVSSEFRVEPGRAEADVSALLERLYRRMFVQIEEEGME